jgi:RRXRR protein
MRIPVQNPDGTPAMPTKPSRARKWVRDGKAKSCWSDIGLYYVQLVAEPAARNIQPIVVGIDPGKLYSGIAVQSSKFTLFAAHLVLPFKTVKDRMEQRAMMRRGRRGRRINRKVEFKLRAHRQARFNNRRGKKLPPSIRANRQLELRVVVELSKLFPLSQIVYEYVQARGDKSFSPVMVGQIWMLEQLELIAPTVTRFGWETSNLRDQLGLVKQKNRKGEAVLATHAVDGIALASSYFIRYESFEGTRDRGHVWTGKVTLTSSVFRVIRRPPVSRRQLHLMVPAKGGVRRKYGGTTTRHGFRKGDLVDSPKGVGYVSGDTERQVSVSDSNWKRLGQIAASKVSLIRRSNGLIVA